MIEQPGVGRLAESSTNVVSGGGCASYVVDGVFAMWVLGWVGWQPDLPMVLGHWCRAWRQDDWLGVPPARGGAAAQSHWAVRGRRHVSAGGV